MVTLTAFGLHGVTPQLRCSPASALAPHVQQKAHRTHCVRRRRPRCSVDASQASQNGTTLPVQNIVVIGSGPAGYTAAIYAGRANLRPIVLEGVGSGVPGGQLMTTAEVENFPGFPEGISGPELMRNMRDQAARWGADLVSDDCVSLELTPDGAHMVRTANSGELLAHAVVIATGASALRLGIPGEHDLWSRGISACAICDGAAPIFQGVPIAVVGGGDSAAEEAVYLTKYASEVHLLVRSDRLRASKTLQDRVRAHPRVHVHLRTAVVEALSGAGSGPDGMGGSPLRGVRVREGPEGARVERNLSVRGLFYAIGHTPNTSFLRDSAVKLGRAGHVLTRAPGSPETHVDGVFVAGDVADHEWRQAVTAAGSGCMAAIAAERWLAERGLAVEVVALPVKQQREDSAEQIKAEQRGSDDESTFDEEETWHYGQFALRKLYHSSKRPLIVKYISPNCGPCGQLKPILNAVVREFESDSQIHYVEIDITQDAEIAEAAGVTGSPTVQIFHEKSLITTFRGVKMKSEYRRAVKGILESTVAVKK